MIRSILVILELLIYMILTLPLLLLLILLRLFDRQRSEVLSRKCVRLLMRLILFTSGTKVTVTGLENIPKDEPVLYVPNHRSYFDFLVTFCNLPDLCYVGKRELAYPPVLGQWVWLIGTLLLNRKNRREGYRTIEEAARQMREEKKSILIFPEGTRNKGVQEEPLRFKEGSLKIAVWSGCKVIPMAILHTRDIYENHRPVIRPTEVRILAGTPIDPADLSEEEKKHFAASVRETVIQMMLKEEKKNG